MSMLHEMKEITKGKYFEKRCKNFMLIEFNKNWFNIDKFLVLLLCFDGKE